MAEWYTCMETADQFIERIERWDKMSLNARTEKGYMCVTNCPELDYDDEAHCTVNHPDEAFERYPNSNGCPCGNTPIWVYNSKPVKIVYEVKAVNRITNGDFSNGGNSWIGDSNNMGFKNCPKTPKPKFDPPSQKPKPEYQLPTIEEIYRVTRWISEARKSLELPSNDGYEVCEIIREEVEKIIENME